MSKKIYSLSILAFLSFILFSFCFALEEDTMGDLNYWCSTTPHPEPCKIFMGGHDHSFIPKQRADFRTMAVRVAMDRALEASERAKKAKRHCQNNKHKKLAWLDCSKLLEDTVYHLNQTLIGLNQTTSGCSDFDAQTWLSSAMTTLETCRGGSMELNVSHFINPLISNNVSELISNSLAINGVFLDHQDDTQGGYPSWLSASDRRLLQSTSSLISKANVVVALDGSTEFKSIQDAIEFAVKNRKGTERIIVYVKKGIYNENIEITNRMSKITLVGDGLRLTKITGSRSTTDGFTTYSSATVGVTGPGFMARGITFQNTAGPAKGQAVALRSASDLAVYYACSIEGYQDTLFALAQRQFFKSCYIYGTIDFIFGNAAIVIQNSILYVRKPLNGQANVITAQGRGDPFQNTGISIHHSRVLPAPDLKPVVGNFRTYLGRPWQKYSRTVYLQTYLDTMVSPEGWLAWDNSDFAQDTLYFGEYENFGPSAPTNGRVNWKGLHILGNDTAAQFSVANLIAGKAWLPATGVPFTAGL